MSAFSYDRIVKLNVRNKLEKINIAGGFKTDEPMSLHTTFKTGGPADYFIIPQTREDLIKILSLCKTYHIPYFILGGGANILISDRGIRGIVIDMNNFSRITCRGPVCSAQSGARISTVAETAEKNNLSGIEFIYSMPGSVGGAIWMNARCYGASLSDVLISVDYLDSNLTVKHLNKSEIEETFGYKKSFFQNTDSIILGGDFLLKEGDAETIHQEMRSHKDDREKKGHFLYPSAGSVFKNNRAFGKPTGTILDSLGLKGIKRGDAQISDFHGNIIINRGAATSKDVRELITLCSLKAENRLGIKLECEIQFIGDWE